MSLDQSKYMTCYSPIRLFALAGLLLPGSFGEQASAQVSNLRGQAGAVSRTDPYGNARPTYRERRSIGSFVNDVQRQATRGYQGSGRRLNRRGGYADFVLGGDLFRPRRSSPLRYPYPGAAVPAVIRRTYAQYGGFERRELGALAGDIETAMMRRRNLLDATSLNAPVHRARVAHGVGMSARAVVEEPFSAQAEPSEPGAEALSLDAHLLKQINRNFLQKRSEGWSLFRKGGEDASQFRRAARSFQAAVILDSTDFESRIGLLLSHLSLQEYHTAVVLLAELTRHDPAPFSHDLDLVELYGDTVRARQVRMNCGALAQATGHDPSVVALHAFVLWYAGDKEQAIAVAEDLAGEHPIAVFVNWPTQMRAALADSDVGGKHQ